MPKVTMIIGLTWLATIAKAQPYLLVADTSLDQLARIELDGTVAYFGSPGDLNFPSVTALFWNPATHELYGYDDLLSAFLSIDPTTGVGEFLSFADDDYSFFETACDAEAGNFYGIREGYNGIVVVDPFGGSASEFLLLSETPNVLGLEYVAEAFGPSGAFYYKYFGELRAVIGPDWNVDIQITPGFAPHEIAYDSEQDAMYGVLGSSVYSVNRINGNVELLCSISVGTKSNPIVVGGDLKPDECKAFDTDIDGDVDLVDYEEFRACFTEPIECLSADANGDGYIDPLDVGYVMSRFGECD